MQNDLLNIALAFIEGFALIISPCILPILPIILSGSLTGSKKRPFGIIIGFVFAFAFFTFFSRKLVQYTGIDLTLIRHVSYILLVLLGVIMLSTYLTEKLTQGLRRLANIGSTFTVANNPQGGLVSGVLFGCLVGIVWTPCAGPILAAVIVQTVIQETTVTSFLTVLSFGIGAAVPMLVIVLFGRKVMTRVNFFKIHAMLLRKILGAIIIAAVFYMIYGEGISPALAQAQNQQQAIMVKGVAYPYAAPPIEGISDWLNSTPLQLKQLKGKVVLIDFWTYSCINCIRTIPYLNDWYAKYHKYGFEIIGVHTPEFEFEKYVANVRSAVIKYGIHYPVALDNQFKTWRNFQNKYWPAHYLINKNGDVVYLHFGEGEYEVTENNIRYLLGIKTNVLPGSPSIEKNQAGQTPETYLGYERADHFMSPEQMILNNKAQYTFPVKLATNDWALQGDWIIQSDKIISAQAGAAIKIHFNAQQVYVVMGSSYGLDINVKMLLNGGPVTTKKGGDVVNSQIIINKHRLYHVIKLSNVDNAILQLIPSAAGLELYTFTFGS